MPITIIIDPTSRLETKYNSSDFFVSAFIKNIMITFAIKTNYRGFESVHSVGIILYI